MRGSGHKCIGLMNSYKVICILIEPDLVPNKVSAKYTDLKEQSESHKYLQLIPEAKAGASKSWL